MSEKLMIGMSQVDMTPLAPVSLRGQFHSRISKSVESPLLVNVFAAEADGQQIIICACDLLDVNAGFCERVRLLIRYRQASIDVSKIIFCATHTHTGPSCFKTDNTLHVAAKYLPADMCFVDPNEIPEGVWLEEQCGAYIAEKMCEAVIMAWDKRKPASYSPSFGRAVIGHCRRIVYDDASSKMYGAVDTSNFIALEGGNDSGIELVYFFDESRKPLGALVNVACPSQVVEHECYISSDYWGKVRDKVWDKLGEDFVVVGLCSAAGDQSPRDMIRKKESKARREDPNMRTLDGAIEIGRRISNVVLEQYEKAKHEIIDDAVIRHETLTIDFPLRTVTITEYQEAKQKFDDYVAKSGKKIFYPQDMSDLHVFGGIMERFATQNQSYFYTSEIHVACFADIAIATSPFELFLDYGNQIRARSAATQTILIQLACDSGGYLPTAKAEHGSHYSATVSSGQTGHDGGRLLVSKTLDVIQKLLDRTGVSY
ncbi:MAG: hypothetical protein SCM11_02895 [Bacillota bacterium]|nr:hypothetical protein [Bacillota bacterium]